MALSKTAKIILSIVAVFAVIFIGAIAFAGYKAYSFFSYISEMKEPPEELKEPRITKGDGFLKKSEFFKMEQAGISDVIRKTSEEKDEKKRQRAAQSEAAKMLSGFDDIKQCGNDIIALGRFGAYVFEKDGKPKEQILLEPSAEKIKIFGYDQINYDSNFDNLEIVDTNNDGNCEYLSFDITKGVIVFDNQGNQVWKFGGITIDLGKVFDQEELKKDIEEEKSVRSASVFDTDGDGKAEYIVSRRKDGVRAFDQSGKEKWFLPEEKPWEKLHPLDIDGDGKVEILALGSNSKLLDMGGKPIREIKGADDANGWFFAEGKDKKRLIRFIRLDENKLSIQDESETEIAKGEAPLNKVKRKNPEKIDMPDAAPPITLDTESAYEAEVVPVKLFKDKSEYIAIINSYTIIPRANLYLYEQNGTLVYHELLPEEAKGIMALRGEDGIDDIFVSGSNTIWKYSMK